MKDYTFKVKRNKKSNSADVTMAGQLNVSNMSDIKIELEKTLKGSKTISLNISDVEDTDITLVQMLASFKTACADSKIELNISLELNDDYKGLFEKAGLLTILNKH